MSTDIIELTEIMQKEIEHYFGNAVHSFQISELNADVNHLYFNMEFVAFDYFWVGIVYDRGRLNPYIIQGEHRLFLTHKGKIWWDDNLNLPLFVRFMFYNLYTRIPKRYLKDNDYIHSESEVMVMNENYKEFFKSIFS